VYTPTTITVSSTRGVNSARGKNPYELGAAVDPAYAAAMSGSANLPLDRDLAQVHPGATAVPERSTSLFVPDTVATAVSAGRPT